MENGKKEPFGQTFQIIHLDWYQNSDHVQMAVNYDFTFGEKESGKQV